MSLLAGCIVTSIYEITTVIIAYTTIVFFGMLGIKCEQAYEIYSFYYCSLCLCFVL